MPAATGGDGTLRYAIEPALPGGLSFNGTTRGISGTTRGTAVNRQYTLVATDVDGDRGTRNFYFSIGRELTFGGSGPTLRLRIGHRFETDLPAAAGGDGTVWYSIGSSPALPAGLTFVNRSSSNKPIRTLFGWSTRAHPKTTYTLTATDRDSDTATLVFSIEVTTNRTPAFGAATTHARRFQIGAQSFVHSVLPAASGGDGALTYTVSPALPRGLALTGTPPVISGVPTESTTEATYTLTARDIDGDAATLTFPLAVSSAFAPRVSHVGIASSPSRGGDTYAAGDAITVRIGFTHLIAVGAVLAWLSTSARSRAMRLCLLPRPIAWTSAMWCSLEIAMTTALR